VDVEPVKRLKKPVTMERVKQHPGLKDFDLVRISRLSVMPVSSVQWKTIEGMSK
jgi:predicted RNA-binding protein with PUA-like domain